MIVTVELPNFPEDEHRLIRVMSGIEERARKFPGKEWEIKTSQCNMCGKCCMNVPDDWVFGKNHETGHCINLVYNAGWDNGETKFGWLCGMGTSRPFSCSTGDEAGQDHCSVKWSGVK